MISGYPEIDLWMSRMGLLDILNPIINGCQCHNNHIFDTTGRISIFVDIQRASTSCFIDIEFMEIELCISRNGNKEIKIWRIMNSQK